MKTQIKLMAVAGLLAFASCSKEETIQDKTADLTISQINVSAKDQVPNELYDAKKAGIYHGIVAHQSTQSRGKIWINVGNNTNYTATIEMVDGTVMDFVNTSGQNASYEDVNQSYEFSGAAGSFTVIMDDINNPEITNMVLNQEAYFGYVLKSTSTNRATSYNGTFSVTGGTLTGTWNVLSNGQTNPNGQGGQAISSVVVTYNDNMYTDNVMESYNANCITGAPFIPQVDIFNNAFDGVLAGVQTSNFGGFTEWELKKSNARFGGEYRSRTCNPMPGGTFTLYNSTTSYSGTILID